MYGRIYVYMHAHTYLHTLYVSMNACIQSQKISYKNFCTKILCKVNLTALLEFFNFTKFSCRKFLYDLKQNCGIMHACMYENDIQAIPITFPFFFNSISIFAFFALNPISQTHSLNDASALASTSPYSG